MPIYAPGKRRKNQIELSQRDPVSHLSLTPMVDMFTVLVVFLLQNFAVTGTPIEIYKDVNLPPAVQTKPLKPTNVITINLERILFNNEEVMSYDDLRERSSWFILELNKKVKEVIKKKEMEAKQVTNILSDTIKGAIQKDKKEEDKETSNHLRLTVQADKDVDFLSIKKAMYTAMEAGILEVNFAVIQEKKKKN